MIIKALNKTILNQGTFVLNKSKIKALPVSNAIKKFSCDLYLVNKKDKKLIFSVSMIENSISEEKDNRIWNKLDLELYIYVFDLIKNGLKDEVLIKELDYVNTSK